MTAARGYVVCATQRSGSTYLCRLLESTGVLGRPLDFFNAAGRRDKGWTDYPDDLREQLGIVLAHGTTPNGVYGLKAFPEHLDDLIAAGWTDRLPHLHWVSLRRADLLGQAISLVIAKQTGRWRSTAPASGPPAYDADAIRAELGVLAHGDARWRAYFAERGIRPLELEYENVRTDPQAAVCAVAALTGVAGEATIDLARVDLTVQRTAENDEWRERFLRDGAPHPARTRPQLTVSILTRNSEARLPALLAEVSHYADQILVGVDASSTDRTLETACLGADLVYRFRLPRPGQLGPARMLAFDYATGDWILTLDDDESMESSFDTLLPELLRAPGVTHYFFPRKWVVGDAPWEYAHAAPWFPNWSPRLFRNDRSLVWKPARAHSMHFVQGPGYYESRAAIVHFEPLWCPPAQRARKLAAYADAGAEPRSEAFYAIPADAPRRPFEPRVPRPPARRTAGIVREDVREPALAQYPPFCSVISEVDMPGSLQPGGHAIVRATAHNTGTLAWTPTYAQWPANYWPAIRLSYWLYDAQGARLGDGERTLLPRFVAPGDQVTFIAEFTAPEVPGDYIVQWDLVSESHCWFAECGATVFRSPLSVVPDGAQTDAAPSVSIEPDRDRERAALTVRLGLRS